MKLSTPYHSLGLCLLATSLTAQVALGRGGESSGDHPSYGDPVYFCAHVAGGQVVLAVVKDASDQAAVQLCRLGDSLIGARTLMDAVQLFPIPKAADAYLTPAPGAAGSAEEACRSQGALPESTLIAGTPRTLCHFSQDDSWIDGGTLLQSLRGKLDPVLVKLFGPLPPSPGSAH